MPDDTDWGIGLFYPNREDYEDVFSRLSFDTREEAQDFIFALLQSVIYPPAVKGTVE
jgi:hypothetical protein